MKNDEIKFAGIILNINGVDVRFKPEELTISSDANGYIEIDVMKNDKLYYFVLPAN